MKQQRWVGNHLYNLLNLETAELYRLYPDYDRAGLRSIKADYKRKLREGRIKMPPTPEQEPQPIEGHLQAQNFGDILRLHNMTPELAQEFTEQGFHVGYIKNKDGEIEYTVPLPNAKNRGGRTLDEFEPVEPARITPTRAKRLQRASNFILVYGDGQVDFRRIIDPVTDESRLVPLHNVPMHNIIQQFNARFRPETTVNLGDFADMSALSKFDPDSDHFHKTLGPSMRYIHDFYARLVANNPDAEHVEVDSNHAVRIKKQTLRNLPALHDFVIPGEDYPLMTYYRLANLGRLGINFISGYGGAEYVYGEEYGAPPIVFKHGTHSSSTPGATVKKESVENPEVHVVRGHGHGDEHISITTRSGRRLFYYQIGSSCLNDGPVPGYGSSVDDHNQPVKYHNRRHQNTFALIEDFRNGEYQVDIVNVINGVAYYRGEEFNGNE